MYCVHLATWAGCGGFCFLSLCIEYAPLTVCPADGIALYIVFCLISERYELHVECLST